jgi:hypothetical protein
MCVCLCRRADTGTACDPVVEDFSGRRVCDCGWCLETDRFLG